VDEAIRHGDRMIVLAAGRLLFSGTADAMVAEHGRGDGEGAADAAELAFIRLVEGRERR
jgi:hypothetical protein